MKLTNKIANIAAAILLGIMLLITFGVMGGDSLTMDEKSHLPAGYSYITQQDMRINPEHPPLVKDLAGIGQLAVPGINFPYDSEAWTTMVNGQWDFGKTLLFESGNPADEMIFWGRVPMILMLLLLGFFLFKWTRELFGNVAGLLALFLLAFSPTFLAHGHLVTTDVAAALGAFVATYYFVKCLKNPSWKNIIISGVALGIAELLKFSMILLFPMFILIAGLWWLIKMVTFKKAFQILFASFAICFLVIWPVYQFHVWNYPPARQVSDSKEILSSHGFGLGADLVVWAADKPVLRPYAQYFLGVMMVTQRVVGGNTTYFLGQVSKTSWKTYFPVVYLSKETAPFHIFVLIAIIYALSKIKQPRKNNFAQKTKMFIVANLPQISMLLFLAIYWTSSVSGNLNIGVRHLMPVFPFTMALAAGGIMAFANNTKWKLALVAALCGWQAISVALTYPNYLAYFNEISGGINNGYKIAVDSNLDWGQDLKRLKNWADKNGVQTIYLDYFGGADQEYYFGDRVQGWWASRDRNELPKGSYLAVSATFLQGQRATPVPGSGLEASAYEWLNKYTPVAIIGHSIFVYHIE
ncbi:MAG: glycosyltransferase family 39 protein [Candidatus Paceibacterota bacterium]